MGGTVILCDSNSGALSFAKQQIEKALANYSGEITIKLLSKPDGQYTCGTQAQGYKFFKQDNSIVVAGADEAGAMYGGLDLAQHFELGGTVESLGTKAVDAFVKQRGIKFNIPLDARTPSYSDGGDSAQENIANVWDMDFWHGFIDRMALNKFNVLSLWSESPGPSMVKVPEYPDVALADVKRAAYPPRSTLRGTLAYTETQAKSLITVKKLTIEEKIKFWQEVMEYAKSRCVSVYIFTWNVFVYGTEHTDYGITDDADSAITKDYVMRTVEALVRTYPLLAGFGITAGENMHKEWKIDAREDIEWVMETYGKGIMAALKDEPERDVALIQRSHMTTVEQMEEVLSDFTHTFEVSFKYSMAHMYSAAKPHFGDNFFNQLKNGRKSWLTVRSDDFYSLRWGDTDFAREYIKQMPHEYMKGFYMGPDGLVWGKEYTIRDPKQNGAYFFDRHWFSFAIWGRLAYNINLSDDYFTAALAARYGSESAKVYSALQLASRGVPVQQLVNWHDYDFQWYPECCCSHLQAEDLLIFHSLNDFINSYACPGTGYISIEDYCSGLAAGSVPDGITPEAAVAEMRKNCGKALEILAGIKGSFTAEDEDLLADTAALAKLGLYYAEKIQASVHLLMHRKTGDANHKASAVACAETACKYWVEYSSSIAKRYRPQRLNRIRNVASPDLFDKFAEIDVLIAQNG